MEPKALKHPYKHSQLNINEEDLNEKSKDTQQNQKFNSQLSSSQHIIFSYLSNINDAERNFSLLNQENLISNSKDYQKYIKNFHKFHLLYFIQSGYRFGDKLIIYNTKTKSEKKLSTSQNKTEIDPLTCITELPNGELFCYGSNPEKKCAGTTVLIDRDFNYHILPPSGEHFCRSSAIYYNRSVYCFSSWNLTIKSTATFCNRFDLDRKKWVKLSLLQTTVWNCNAIIFNGNILIANDSNWLWLYSIYINSFSIIPYKFQSKVWKIIINAEERLYLIESDDHWLIYESKIGDEYVWELIRSYEHIKDSYGVVKSCFYNKEKERIDILTESFPTKQYYKFNLNEKVLLTKKKKCIIF